MSVVAQTFALTADEAWLIARGNSNSDNSVVVLVTSDEIQLGGPDVLADGTTGFTWDETMGVFSVVLGAQDDLYAIASTGGTASVSVLKTRAEVLPVPEGE